MADDAGGLRVASVANPAAPTEVSFYDTPGQAWGVALAGNYAYLADGSSGLRIISIASPAVPTEVGSHGRPAQGVAVAGTYAYTVADGLGLHIDLANLAAPEGVGFYNTPERAFGVVLAGNPSAASAQCTANVTLEAF